MKEYREHELQSMLENINAIEQEILKGIRRKNFRIDDSYIDEKTNSIKNTLNN